MCSAHRPHIVCMVGLCATGNSALVHLVVRGFGLVNLPWHCWEGLVVDCLPVVGYFLGCGVDYCLGFGVSYFWLALVGYWGLASWDSFVVQTPIPTEQVEKGRGIKQIAPVMHSRLGWVLVPQMWEFVLRIVVLSKPRPEPVVVVQVVRKNLRLWIGTSFFHSLEFGFGRKH